MPLQVDQLRWMASEHGDEPAYTQVTSGATLTFAEWDAISNREARGLVAAGVARGDRVLLHLDDVHLLRWITTYAAIHKAGAVAVPSNVRLTAHELAGIVEDAQPVAAVTSLRLSPIVSDACTTATATRSRLIEADDLEQWADLTADADEPFQVEVDDGDLADIMYTSGTTGRAKGVAVRHRNTHMIANGEKTWTGDGVDPLLAAVDLRRHQLRAQPDEDGHAGPLPPPLRRRPRGSRRSSASGRPPRSSCRPWCSCCWPTSGAAPPTCRA